MTTINLSAEDSQKSEYVRRVAKKFAKRIPGGIGRLRVRTGQDYTDIDRGTLDAYTAQQLYTEITYALGRS
jgi:hypothetical protein